MGWSRANFRTIEPSFRVTADELSTQLGAVGVGFDVLNEFSGLIAEPTDEGEQGKAAVSRMCIRRRST